MGGTLVDSFGWVGQELDGRYRVERVVGGGGFGIVYRAQHLALGGPVAIKCLDVEAPIAQSQREEFLQAFQAEGRILHQLSSASPAIVRPLDLSVAISPSGIWTPYLVLEWLEGATLDEHVKGLATGPTLGIDEAFRLLTPVAEALQIAHARGIAHRDVKPANLFVARTDRGRTMKVLDFGIAKVMGHGSSAHAVTGPSLKAFSLAYAAPEQLDPGPMGHGATGPWTDVYALALIFVELAAGRRAYVEGDFSAIFEQALAGRRPTLRSVGLASSDALESVLERALAVDARNRPHSAGAFWEELATALRGPAPVVSSPRTEEHPSASAPPALTRASSGAPLVVPGMPAPGTRPTRAGSSLLPWIAGAAVGVIAVGAITVALNGSDEGKEGPPPLVPTHPSADTTATKKPLPQKPKASDTIVIQNEWVGVTVPADEVDGASAARPVFRPSDRASFQKQHSDAWNWSDKCFSHRQTKELGWAKGSCIVALQELDAKGDADGARSHALFNLGLIERDLKNIAMARELMREAVRLQTKSDVTKRMQDALDAVGEE